MANRSTPGRTDKRDDGVAHIGLDEIGAGERYVMEPKDAQDPAVLGH
ncbi:hypothetical protein N9A78_02075 [Akkermansiaceae bacterium]|nr:hypothetical protein [Akkermansiaceae bacterium]